MLYSTELVDPATFFFLAAFCEVAPWESSCVNGGTPWSVSRWTARPSKIEYPWGASSPIR